MILDLEPWRTQAHVLVHQTPRVALHAALGEALVAGRARMEEALAVSQIDR